MVRDLIASKFLIHWITPFLWFFLGLFAFMSYRNALPLLLQKQYIYFLVALSVNFIWMSLIITFVIFALVAMGFLLKRMKGIAGEHVFVFNADSFTEKTAYNENTVTYSKNIRLYETRNHFLMALSLGNFYHLPKRFLDPATVAALKEFLKPRLNYKRATAHYVMIFLLFIAVIFAGFEYQSARYNVLSHAAPFQAMWNEHELYIYGGRSVVGREVGLFEFAGFNSDAVEDAKMLKNEEYFLWIARNGKIEKYPIANASGMQVVFFKDRICGIGYSEESNQSVFYSWSGKEFIKESDGQCEEFTKKVDGTVEESTENEATPARISNYEWDRRVGEGKKMELSLGDQKFYLLMNNKRGKDALDQGSFTLSGGWGDSLQELYSVKEGMLMTGKEEFYRLVGKK
jgi:TRAP-type C4-dicarboxylate transport system permease small subunit